MNSAAMIIEADEQPASGALIPQNEIATIVAARDAALKTMASASNALEQAYTITETAMELRQRATGGETFSVRDRTRDDDYKSLFRGNYNRDKALNMFREELDASVWLHIFNRTGVFDMMDMTAKEEWRKSLMNEVPEVTVDNIFATLETVGRDADLIYKRGLAKVFMKLDRRFRSHDGFKIGSRMIINNFFNSWGSIDYGHRRDMIVDVERVMATLDGKAPDARTLLNAIEASRAGGFNPRQSTTDSVYFRVKGFMNGNAHLWFTRDDLVEKANKLLAEYYGELIPDAHGKDTTSESLKSKTNLPSKDLAYYFTPKKAADDMFHWTHPGEGARVLEPSAGTGHLVRPLLGFGCKVDALEIHPERVAALKLIQHPNLRVQQANFLNTVPNPIYDWVVMNPPFSGTHWMEHVVHAFEFLKPGGRLMSILPATAEDGDSAKHEKFRKWAELNAEKWGRLWRDLPQESFAEAGTRINTVILTLQKGGK